MCISAIWGEEAWWRLARKLAPSLFMPFVVNHIIEAIIECVIGKCGEDRSKVTHHVIHDQKTDRKIKGLQHPKHFY